jgi:hypothetical protein
MANNIVTLWNMALDAIGYDKHITEPYDGSPGARVALEVHRQTRQELIQSGDWAFALREKVLVDTGQTPPSPWQIEYIYPSDCVRIRYIRPGPFSGGTRDIDPQPVLFLPWNDPRLNASAGGEAILCDLTSAVLLYSGDVTDPSQWDAGFEMAYVASMAEKFAFGLSAQAEVVKARVGLSARDIMQGMSMDDTTVAEPNVTRAAVKSG